MSTMLKLIEESLAVEIQSTESGRTLSLISGVLKLLINRDFSVIIENFQNRSVCFIASSWVYQFTGKMKVVITYSN